MSAAEGQATARPRIRAISWSDGGRGATLTDNSLRSSAGEAICPWRYRLRILRDPCAQRAGTICAALAIDTSRSSLVPPNNTAIFMAKIWRLTGLPRWGPRNVVTEITAAWFTTVIQEFQR